MIHLQPVIDRIKALLAEDTDASVTYAALEARLALEKVVYDRLRQRHDYISHAELAGWNPSYVVNKVITEVDPHVADTMTLMMGQTPGAKPDEDDYVEIGTQIGFNSKRISKQWNALAKLALHVRVPEHKDDHIADYGNKAEIRAKVDEVVTELERIAKGTMAFSGIPIGADVTFECTCGQQNKRRAALLKEGQSVSCLSPTCVRSYSVVVQDDGGFVFKLESVDVPCAACGAVHLAPQQELLKMRPGDQKLITCLKCGHVNRVACLLARADLASTTTDPTES